MEIMSEGRASTAPLSPAWSSWPRSFLVWAWGSWLVSLAAQSLWFRHLRCHWLAAALLLFVFDMCSRTVWSNWKTSPQGSIFFLGQWHWRCCHASTAGTTYSLPSSEWLQFQSFMKWRLDKTGNLMPELGSFCILTALLLHSCWCAITHNGVYAHGILMPYMRSHYNTLHYPFVEVSRWSMW